MSHLFCFGLGYSAGVIAKRLAAREWSVTGTSTTEQGCAAIQAHGWGAAQFDGHAAAPAIPAALAPATHILLSIPPGADGDPVFHHHGQDIATGRSIAWIGYFSTVGVYGDANGGWVDENTEARPASERGNRRLLAEEQWRKLGREAGMCTNIFRLPGIYGPGRSAIDDVRAGTARRIIKPGQVFNRIHVEDIASAVIAAIGRPLSDRVYNVTDDEPGPPQDVVAYAADLLGLPCPPALDFATAELSPMTRSFYGESKRVANARMKADLGVQLAYPTYREGLTELAKSPGH
ncbi:MAG: SDR family oxidoreductase [Hyphomicrobium sp.]